MSDLVERLRGEIETSEEEIAHLNSIIKLQRTAIETLTREKAALELERSETDRQAIYLFERISSLEARAEAAEKALDDLHEKLQAIGEEFGVDGGEERTAGIRRVLTEQKAHIADAAEVIRPFAEPHFMGDNYVKFAPHLILAARAWTDKHDKGEK